MKTAGKLKTAFLAILLTILGLFACAAVVMAATGNTTSNIYTGPYNTGIHIEKQWNDDGQKENRPESIEVSYKMTLVLSDYVTSKTETVTNEGSVTLSEANSWQDDVNWDYSNAGTIGPSYHLGRDLTVEVEEINVPKGYTASYEWVGNSGYVIVTNTYTEPTGDLSVTKTVSGDNADLDKAFEFTLNLTDADGTPLTEEYSYSILNKDSSVAETGNISNGETFKLSHEQTFTVTGLPEGTLYEVTEAENDDYTSEVVSGNASGAIDSENPAAVTFNNKFNEPEPETVNISGSKIWKDNDDEAGLRPDSIEINLWNGEELVAKTTIDEADGWVYSFNQLAKYDQQGNEIKYTVTETPVKGYSTTYDGYNIINTYTPDDKTPVKPPTDPGEDPSEPTKTSDPADPVAIMMIMMMSAAALVVLKKKSR